MMVGVRGLPALVFLLAASSAWCQSVAPVVHEATIDAPIAEAWAAYTTSEGLRAWLAPHAEIDLRVGGKMRTNYNAAASLDAASSVENTILSFEPERMISIRVSKAPDDFPFAEVIGEMWTVLYFEPLSADRTFVRSVSLGFTLDPQSQAMREFFEEGNATTMQRFKEYLQNGSR